LLLNALAPTTNCWRVVASRLGQSGSRDSSLAAASDEPRR